MSWYNKECPTNSRDAYWEGRQTNGWERNPYQHGRDHSADQDCQDAYKEFERGKRMADQDREMRDEQERQELRDHERRREEDYQWRLQERQMEEEREREQEELEQLQSQADDDYEGI